MVFKLLVINRVYNSSLFPVFSKFAVIFTVFTETFQKSWKKSICCQFASQDNYSNWNSVQSNISFVKNRVTIAGSQQNTPNQIQTEYTLVLPGDLSYWLQADSYIFIWPIIWNRNIHWILTKSASLFGRMICSISLTQ